MRLIDADELKTRVPNTSADIFENCRNCNLLDDWQVKELIDNAPTVEPASLWHRVEEDPKKEKRYLVWDVDGFAYCDTWREGKWQVASTVPGTHITHWMPIEPPKEDA